MKTTLQALDKTEKLELRLAALLEEVAGLMQKPASRRDQCSLADAWQKASHVRLQMKLLAKFHNKIKKPVRRNMSWSDYRAQRDMFKRARAHKKRLRELYKVDHVVQQQFDPVRTPLLPKSQPSKEDALLTHLYKALHLLANPKTQDPDAKGRGCFADIAFPARSFDLLMSAAYRVGLEYDPGYAAAAQQTLQILGTSSTVILSDAMAFDSYSEYDVIYFYRPLRADEHLEKMEQHIIRQASVGTILVAPYDLSLRGRPGMECAKVEGPIFVTGIEQADADQLRSNAEATGTVVPEKRADEAFKTNYWAPILEAASFRGRVF